MIHHLPVFKSNGRFECQVNLIFFNSHSGGGVESKLHSARLPFTGLLYLPRVIVRMENLVE
jgi:hypothetical protein